MGTINSAIEICWQPQKGPQHHLLSCPVEDVMIGGSRGGGKSDGLLLDWVKHAALYGKNARGVFFRRSYPELEQIEARCNMMFPLLGAVLAITRRTWTFPNGATLRLRHLDRDADANSFQGHEYSWVGMDEVTNWPDPVPVDKIRATLRSAAGVPCKLRVSGNPGGPGHSWVKARYIDPVPPYTVFTDPESRAQRVFIPAFLEDNKILLENDPHYWRRVEAAAAGNQALLKAWRYGEWDIVAGGMFDDLWNPNVHIIDPFPIPSSWHVDRSFDWGSSAPFACVWWAESDGTDIVMPDGSHQSTVAGDVFAISELYGWNGKPNEGCRKIASEVARDILDQEQALRLHVQPGPADSAIFAMDNGKSVAADMAAVGVKWEPANKSSGSVKAGCEQIRTYLLNALPRENGQPREHPGLFVFNTCRHFIRTVPVLTRSDKDPDVYDTHAEDHIADLTRYRLFTQKTPAYKSKQTRVVLG